MMITRQNFRIKSNDAPWLTLHLHAVMPEAGSPRAALLLHGATLSGYIFDLPARGPSWQERMAARGWSCYALDARGFGRSTRPGSGDPGFDERRPFAHAGVAMSDVNDAVRFLREERRHEQIALIGFSWGAILAGCFAAAGSMAVNKLTLYAPLYATPNPSWVIRLCDPLDPEAFNPAFGAYRWTSAETLRARWDSDIPLVNKEAWRSEATFRAVLEGALDSDPLSLTRTPPAFRAPNGPFADLFRSFTGHATFDASAIRVPVLIVRGDSDTTSTDADARKLLRELGSEKKYYWTINSGSHFLPFERSAPLLFDILEEFHETAA